MSAGELNRVIMVLWDSTHDLPEKPHRSPDGAVIQRLWELPNWGRIVRQEGIGDTEYVFVEFPKWKALLSPAFWRDIPWLMKSRVKR